jgi:hypothetical protein
MEEDPGLHNDWFVNFLFSFIFAISFLSFLPNSPILVLIYEFILYPFQILHTLGHFSTKCCFFPMLSSQLDLLPSNEEMCSCHITLEELPASWESIFLKASGSILLLSISILGLVFLGRKQNPTYEPIKKFLLFGLLSDLPSLFPILPSVLGDTNDGYGICVLLLRMGFLTYPSYSISVIFSILAVISTLLSIYYLGSLIFNLILLYDLRIHRKMEIVFKI